MDLSAIASIEPEQLRALLPGFLAGFIDQPAARVANRARMAELVAGWTAADLREVVGLLAVLGDEHRLYLAHPRLRALSRAWSGDVVTGSTVAGVEHLAEASAAGPTVVICNHLSYFDSSAIDAMLAWAGRPDLADRLVSAAGPKVYQELFRRFAASCINTLPVPQSTTFSHTESLSQRELATRALESVKAAGEALERGYILLIFPEGSRTRTGQLQPFLPAIRRYLSATPGIRVVPAAISGTDRIMPVSQDALTPAPAVLTFASPRVVDSPGAARDVLAWAHDAVASMLPAEYRSEGGSDGGSPGETGAGP